MDIYDTVYMAYKFLYIHIYIERERDVLISNYVIMCVSIYGMLRPEG